MKVIAVTRLTPSHSACLAVLRKSLAALAGPWSSLIRALRSPSVTFSHHMNTQVHTLCGQV